MCVCVGVFGEGAGTLGYRVSPAIMMLDAHRNGYDRASGARWQQGSSA